MVRKARRLFPCDTDVNFTSLPAPATSIVRAAFDAPEDVDDEGDGDDDREYIGRGQEQRVEAIAAEVYAKAPHGAQHLVDRREQRGPFVGFAGLSHETRSARVDVAFDSLRGKIGRCNYGRFPP